MTQNSDLNSDIKPFFGQLVLPVLFLTFLVLSLRSGQTPGLLPSLLPGIAALSFFVIAALRDREFRTIHTILVVCQAAAIALQAEAASGVLAAEFLPGLLAGLSRLAIPAAAIVILVRLPRRSRGRVLLGFAAGFGLLQSVVLIMLK